MSCLEASTWGSSPHSLSAALVTGPMLMSFVREASFSPAEDMKKRTVEEDVKVT